MCCLYPLQFFPISELVIEVTKIFYVEIYHFCQTFHVQGPCRLYIKCHLEFFICSFEFLKSAVIFNLMDL